MALNLNGTNVTNHSYEVYSWILRGMYVAALLAGPAQAVDYLQCNAKRSNERMQEQIVNAWR